MTCSTPDSGPSMILEGCDEAASRCSLRGGRRHDSHVSSSGLTQISGWTFNAGGWPGFFKLHEFLSTLTHVDRPVFLCLQEIRCALDDWKFMVTKFDTIGYRAFASGNVGDMSHRGVATFVRQDFPSVHFDDMWEQGSAFGSAH